MAILPGRRLGPYEILSAIGAGGMGEVYKARDTRLDRIVAIKVLPAHLADRAELRERFDREARVVASLNHAHICVLHDIGQQDGIDYLVMEYLEGETLAQRFQKGALPIEQVLQYAIEIADALDKAHRKGITHRDLKPGNVMLTKSGTKLLDFGLAKLKQEIAPAIPESQLPTMNSAVTAKGTILGTLQYMAPEQVEAKEVDARTDIFAFGAVVYEMATGRKAFEGKTQASLIAKILEIDPPPISSLQPMTPPALDRVVKKCLSKEPDKRWQAASDVCDELKWIADGGSQAGKSVPISPRQENLGRFRAAVAAAMIAVVVAFAFGYLYFRGPTEEPRVLKFSVLPPGKATFTGSSFRAVSPDGRRIAFAATMDSKDGLWVHDLNSLAARLLPGTQGAKDPFWSPDSRFIAFFAGGKLKKIDMAGGPPLFLCDAGPDYGGTWSKKDIIVFASSNEGLFRVAAAGGAAMPVSGPDQASGENSHRFPSFLPDGHHFLYTAGNTIEEKTSVYVADLDSTIRRRILVASSNAAYAPPGYLFFVRERTLMAQPFDAARVQTAGDPVPIAEQIDPVLLSGNFNQFSPSQNGVLIYSSRGFGGSVQLTWFDRSGKISGTVGAMDTVPRRPAISPDGNTVAVDRFDPQTAYYDLWLHDLVRGSASRFTFGSRFFNAYPVWSPDGSHIAFRSTRDGAANLYLKATSGTAQEEPLDKAARNKWPDDWSRDGRYIIEGISDSKTKGDIWVLPLFGDRKPFPYLQTDFDERFAKLSPNGQWLAYTSDESKRDEVYVQTFPNPGGKWQVSTNGGSRPVWSRDGKQLFFIGLDQKLMAVEVRSDGTKGGAKFDAGVPKYLFDTRISNDAAWFDISKDGRFLIPTQVENSAGLPMTVLVNWQVGLKK